MVRAARFVVGLIEIHSIQNRLVGKRRAPTKKLDATAPAKAQRGPQPIERFHPEAAFPIFGTGHSS